MVVLFNLLETGFCQEGSEYHSSCHRVGVENIHKGLTVNYLKSNLYCTKKNICLFLDCESLIRRILVLDPQKRYTLQQIKSHCWMQAEVGYDFEKKF